MDGNEKKISLRCVRRDVFLIGFCDNSNDFHGDFDLGFSTWIEKFCEYNYFEHKNRGVKMNKRGEG